MNSIIENIVNIANELDNKGNESIADALDSFAEKLTDIKVAQYVGSQGYWVRNSRCWSNCYREKRAQNPSMPAQEVWTSCHEEYVTAMQDLNSGKSTSKWDKYASSEQKINYSDLFDEQFSSLIEKHIDNGMDKGHAIFAAIDDMEMKPYDELVEASHQAFDIAVSLFEKSPREAVKIAHAGEELLKEAQWWQRRMQDMKNPGRSLQQLWDPAVMDAGSQTKLLQSINSLTKAMQTVVQEKSNLVNLANQSGLNQIAQEIENQIPKDSLMSIADGLTRVNQFAQDVMNRQTGGEKGNLVERGMGWLGKQQQQGAEKQRQSDEFFAKQRGEKPEGPGTSQSGLTGAGLDGKNFNIQDSPPYETSYQAAEMDGLNGPGLNTQHSPNQEKSNNGFQTENPILRTHSHMIPSILQVAPDEASLARLFRSYVQRGGGIVDSGGGSYAKSSHKTEKTANDIQNNKGDLRYQVEEYLKGLDSRDVIALYQELLKHVRNSQGYAYSGDSTPSSYGTKSSSKKRVKASVGKTFNLAKFRDGGAT